jgi:hypothetical protein
MLKNTAMEFGLGQAGSCEYDIEPSSSIRGGEFLDKLNYCQRLKDAAAGSSLILGPIGCS